MEAFGFLFFLKTMFLASICIVFVNSYAEIFGGSQVYFFNTFISMHQVLNGNI